MRAPEIEPAVQSIFVCVRAPLDPHTQNVLDDDGSTHRHLRNHDERKKGGGVDCVSCKLTSFAVLSEGRLVPLVV